MEKIEKPLNLKNNHSFAIIDSAESISAQIDKFAIIKTGGKQYKVKVGDILKVEKLPQKTDTNEKKLQFKDILFGQTVTASIITTGRCTKVRVLKFHPKKRYKKILGHRQNFSQIKIIKIV